MFNINESCKSSDATFYADCVVRKQRLRNYGILLIITILVIIVVTTTSLLSDSYWQYILIGVLVVGAIGVVAYTEKFVRTRAVSEFSKIHDINNFNKRYSDYKKMPNASTEIVSPLKLVPLAEAQAQSQAQSQYDHGY